MKIRKIRTIPGPNFYHALPILVMTLDLEELAETSSTQIPGFVERLIEAIPGLKQHHCSKGYDRGFVERLQTGTYLGHIVEHIAIELSGPAGIQVGFGKTVSSDRKGHYDVIVRYRDERAMSFLLRTAVEIAEALIAGRSYPIAEKVEQAKKMAEESKLGPSTQSLVEAAEKRGIPWTRLSEGSLIELGYGVYRRRIQAATSSETGYLSVDIAQDKDLTKILLERALLPVPCGEVVTSAEEALEVFGCMNGPAAIKPLDGNHGRGVSLNLRSPEEIREAFQIASKHSTRVVIEDYITGKDYRIIVIGEKVVAAAERVPAHVIGDGVHTVRELIETENWNPLRGEGHEKALTKIKIDDEASAFLRRSGVSLDSIPTEGTRVLLRETANLSTGGTAIDVTDQIHPTVASICERAALQVGLDICGVDFIAEDISRDIDSQKCAIIEVNAGPGIRMHHFPTQGKPRDVAGAIMDRLFPKQSNGRIPIVSVTGTNGKTTVTRLIGHCLLRSGRKVGMTTSDGIFVDGECTYKGDTTGPHSARAILSDSRVEVAVLETARGGIIRRGLGYDRSDVGVIMNVQPDHIGQDGIETVDDILKIKGLVAETVRPGGTVVLNADDPRVLSLRENSLVKIHEKNLVLFTLETENPEFLKHIETGGTGYYLYQGGIYEAKAWTSSFIGRAAMIPMTFGGVARYQIANLLGAMAATRALGYTIEEVRASVENFHPTLNNSGRSNAYRVGSGYVFIDYAHNPEAIRAMAAMGRALTSGSLTGVIAVPGDRSEDMIRMSGQAAAEGFDRVIIREDTDLRGRRAGETAELLRSEVIRVNPKCVCKVLPDPKESLREALATLKRGEIVMYFYEKLESAMKVLSEFNAEPVTEFRDFLSLSHSKFQEVS